MEAGLLPRQEDERDEESHGEEDLKNHGVVATVNSQLHWVSPVSLGRTSPKRSLVETLVILQQCVGTIQIHARLERSTAFQRQPPRSFQRI